MPFLKTFFLIIIPGSLYSTFLAFRLGRELPTACRKLGHRVGMGYNYFKVVLKLMAA
jgi:hypothetical protein